MTLLRGDCLEKLKTLKANSVDSLITDPPAGISFMNKAWDSDKGGRDGWIKWMTQVMSECQRVMKPGAHGLVWAIPRTSHWTATALENAGFEVRDVITHLFGSGFPKSLNIAIALDKQAGAMKARGKAFVTAGAGERKDIQETSGWEKDPGHEGITPAAKQWQGYGTALKPASEHWILVRKPCSEKTVAKNVLKWGTGGINIDGSRIGTGDNLNGGAYSGNTEKLIKQVYGEYNKLKPKDYKAPTGRFPANLILSHTLFCTDTECEPECAVKMLDGQSGLSKSTKPKKSDNRKAAFYQAGNSKSGGFSGEHNPDNSYEDNGGASRFFYCAKASKRERNAGLEGMPKKPNTLNHMEMGIGAKHRQANAQERAKGISHVERQTQVNSHPTVKPQKLMQYLITLITPHNGIVLDPFMGSGSTGVAAKALGFKFIGIEKEKEYFEIAKRRVKTNDPKNSMKCMKMIGEFNRKNRTREAV